MSIIKPLADMLSGLPDTIERVTGAGTEVINVVSKVVDERCLVMFEQLDRIVNGSFESHGDKGNVGESDDSDITEAESFKKPPSHARVFELTDN